LYGGRCNGGKLPLSRAYNRDINKLTAVLRTSYDSFVPLPKSSNPERIQHNAEVFDFDLSQDDMAKLDELDRGKDGAISWNPVDVD
jgi:diketogulonate reductase-like aldo/keto reductase